MGMRSHVSVFTTFACAHSLPPLHCVDAHKMGSKTHATCAVCTPWLVQKPLLKHAEVSVSVLQHDLGKTDRSKFRMQCELHL